MKKENLVSYSMLVKCKPNGKVYHNIQKTMNFYDKGVGCCQELLLNIMARIEPRHCNKLKEVFYFVNVFSVEHKSTNGKIINSNDIPSLFNKYWKNEGGGQYNKDIIRILSNFNIREDMVWVDRKATSIEYFAKNSIYWENELDLLFNSYGFPFPKAKETDKVDVKYWRPFFSKVFGTGKKADTNVKNLSDRAAVNSFSIMLNNENYNINLFIELFFRYLGIQTKEEFNSLGVQNKSTYIKKLNAYFNGEKIEFTKEFIKSELAKLETKLAATEVYPSKNWDLVLKIIEDAVGISYFQDRLLLPEFEQCMSLAHGQILSTRSNAINQCLKLIEYNEQYQNRERKFDLACEKLQIVSKRMSILCQTESYQIHDKQLNPIREIAEHIKSGSSLQKALDDINTGRRFDLNNEFLIELFSVIDNVVEIEGGFKIYELLNNIKYLKYPGYNPVCGKIWFGTSKPYGKLCKPVTSNIVEYIELSLFDGKKFVINKLWVRGKRITNEILRKFDGGFKVPRKDKYASSDDCRLRYSLDDTEPAISLFSSGNWLNGDDKFYVNISYPLGYVKAKEEIDCTFGFDLGWRNPVSTALIDKDNNWLERGELTNEILSSKGRKASDNDLEWAQLIFNRYKKPKDKMNEETNRCSLFLLTSNILLRARVEDINLYFNDVKDLVRRVSPELINEKGNIIDMGGLNQKRIKLYSYFIKLFSRCISFGLNAASFRERAYVKYNNLRIEKYRLTASMICHKILDVCKNHGKVLVVAEFLSSKPDGKNSSDFNSRISSWYSARIIADVKRFCKTHGIKFTLANAAGTSHENENGFAPRLRKLNSFAKKEEFVKEFNFWKNKKDFTSSRDKNVESEIDRYYFNVWKNLRNKYGNNFNEFIKNYDLEYVPWKKGGWYMESIQYGIISSDQLAAYIIAKRGLAYFASGEVESEILETVRLL